MSAAAVAAAGVLASAQSSALVRMDILPVAVGYAVIMGALATGLLLLRRPGGGAAPGGHPESSGGARTASHTEPGTAGAAGASAGPAPAAPVGLAWRRLILHYATTAVGGYLLLMAVLIAYYFGVVHVGGDFISSAFTGCAMLIGLSAPVFLAASVLTERRRLRRGPRAARSPTHT